MNPNEEFQGFSQRDPAPNAAPPSVPSPSAVMRMGCAEPTQGTKNYAIADDYAVVLEKLAKSMEMSPNNVLRAAIRLYQMHREDATKRTFLLQPSITRKFRMGDYVKKTKGSSWEGTIVGFYRTALTPEGYAVESATERGSVQIYPASALEAADPRDSHFQQALEVINMLVRGIKWNIDTHPEVMGGADDEAVEQAETFVARFRP